MRRIAIAGFLIATICNAGCSSSPEACEIEGLTFTRGQGPTVGNRSDYFDTAIDSQGNVYFAFRQGTSLTIQGVEYPSTDGTAVLLISFDPAGVVRWGQQISGGTSGQVIDVVVNSDDSLVVAGYASGDSTSVFGTTVSLPSDPFGDYFLARLDTNGVLGGVEVIPETAPNSTALYSLAAGASGSTIESGRVCGTSTHACGTTQSYPTTACRPFVCEVDANGGYVRYVENSVVADSPDGFQLVRGRDGKLYGYREKVRSVTPLNAPTVTSPWTNTGSTFIVRFDDQLRIVAALEVGPSRIIGLEVDEAGTMAMVGDGILSLLDRPFSACPGGNACSVPFTAAVSAAGSVQWVSEGVPSSPSAGMQSIAGLSDGTYLVGGIVGGSSIAFAGATIRANSDNTYQRFYLRYDASGRIVSHALAPILGEQYSQGDVVSRDGVVHTLGMTLRQPHSSSACVGAPSTPQPRDWSIDFLSFDFVTQ